MNFLPNLFLLRWDIARSLHIGHYPAGGRRGHAAATSRWSSACMGRGHVELASASEVNDNKAGAAHPVSWFWGRSTRRTFCQFPAIFAPAARCSTSGAEGWSEIADGAVLKLDSPVAAGTDPGPTERSAAVAEEPLPPGRHPARGRHQSVVSQPCRSGVGLGPALSRKPGPAAKWRSAATAPVPPASAIG